MLIRNRPQLSKTRSKSEPDHKIDTYLLYLARLPSERVPPIKKTATMHQSDFEAFFQQAIYAIQAGQSSTLRRILQVRTCLVDRLFHTVLPSFIKHKPTFKLNKLSTEFNMNAYDKYGRTIASHFAAKCPRKRVFTVFIGPL